MEEDEGEEKLKTEKISIRFTYGMMSFLYARVRCVQHIRIRMMSIRLNTSSLISWLRPPPFLVSIDPSPLATPAPPRTHV